MRITNNTLFKLVLALAPLQCFDFIPNWLIYLYCTALLLSVFIKLPEFLTFIISSLASYQLLKEFSYNLQPESAVGFLNLVLMVKFLYYNGYAILGISYVQKNNKHNNFSNIFSKYHFF